MASSAVHSACEVGFDKANTMGCLLMRAISSAAGLAASLGWAPSALPWGDWRYSPQAQTSVAASDGLIAVAIQADDTQANGLLALFDAVRGGSAREQTLALALLEERLQP